MLSNKTDIMSDFGVTAQFVTEKDLGNFLLRCGGADALGPIIGVIGLTDY